MRKEVPVKDISNDELKAMLKKNPSFIDLKRMTGICVPALRVRMSIPKKAVIPHRSGNVTAEQIAKWYKAGMTMAAIAKELHVSRQRIHQIISGLGLCRLDGGLKKSRKAFEQAVLALMNTEKDVDKVAAAFSCRVESVYNVLKKYGYRLPPQYPELLDAAWLRHQYVDLKKPSTEIARMLGTGYAVVIKYIKKHGIPMGRHGRKRFSDESISIFKDSPDWLQHHYLDLKWTIQQIADDTGSTYPTVQAYLRKYGIPIRTGGWSCSKKNVVQ